MSSLLIYTGEYEALDPEEIKEPQFSIVIYIYTSYSILSFLAGKI